MNAETCRFGLRAGGIILLAVIALTAACQLYRLEKELPPAFGEFLNKVRYIITGEERRIFLQMPDADKPVFVEEFWKRRDPDTSTEENEFKIEYENRFERTKELFIGEGVPGWMTDRGRIYILFGPPTDRQTQSAGFQSQGRCAEVWAYGNFPVVFVDQTCTGQFKLVTFDLSPLRELNLSYGGALTQAQDIAQKTIRNAEKLFDYETELTFVERTPQRIAARLRIRLPYERIWFKSDGKDLRTAFEVSLELRDGEKNLVWEGKAGFPIAISEDDLPAKSGQKYAMEIPIDILDPAKIALLGKGKDLLTVAVVNTTGKETQKKAIAFQ